MINRKTTIKFLVISLFIISASVFYLINQDQKEHMSCDAVLKLYSFKSKEIEYIEGTYHFSLAERNGLIVINVNVKTASGNLSEYHVSYIFDYSRSTNIYTLHNVKYTARINKNTEPSLSDPILNAVFNQYISDVQENLTFRVTKLEGSGYLIYTNKIPLMMCTDELG